MQNVEKKCSQKDRFGNCIPHRPFEPQSRPKPHPHPHPHPTPFPFPTIQTFDLPKNSAFLQTALSATGGALGGAGLGAAMSLTTSASAAGYTAVETSNIEMAELGQLIPEGQFGGGNSAGGIINSLRGSQTIRYRALSNMGRNSYEDTTTDSDLVFRDYASSSRNLGSSLQDAARKARAAAQRSLSNIRQALGDGYTRVSQVDPDDDIEMQNAQSEVDDAQQAVTNDSAAAAEDEEDLQGLDDLFNEATTNADTVASDLASDLTESVGDVGTSAEETGADLFSSAFGTESGDLTTASMGEAGDVGLDMTSEAGSLAETMSSDIGASELAAAPLDFETLGISAAAALVGGVLAGTIGYFAHTQGIVPPSGFSHLNATQASSMLKKMTNRFQQPSSLSFAPAVRLLKTVVAGTNTTPVSLVTTSNHKTAVIQQLTQAQLGQAKAALIKQPNLFAGQDWFVLQAMGLNNHLSNNAYGPNTPAYYEGNMFVGGTKSKMDAGYAQLQATATATAAGQSNKIAAAKANVTAAQTALNAAKANQIAGQAKSTAASTKLATSQTALSTAKGRYAQTKATALSNYAAYATKMNSQADTQAAAYNTQLRANASSIAQAYNTSKAVVDQNVYTALHMTNSITPLLHMSASQTYSQNKATPTHISTTLPGA